jgi:DNA-binding transcriptional regulator GbsR (MarR family)
MFDVTDLLAAEVLMEELKNHVAYTPEEREMIERIKAAPDRNSRKRRQVCTRLVKCVETGDVYKTMTEAAIATGCSKANISQAVNTGCRANGHYWQYAE